MTNAAVTFAPMALRALEYLPGESREQSLRRIALAAAPLPSTGDEVAGYPGLFVVRAGELVRALVTYGPMGPTVHGIFTRWLLPNAIERLGAHLRDVSSNATTGAEFRALQELASRSTGHENVEELMADAVERAPALFGKTQALVVPKNAGEFWSLVSVILAVVTIVLSLQQDPETTIINVNVDASTKVIVNEVTTRVEASSPELAGTPEERSTEDSGPSSLRRWPPSP